MTIEKTPEGDSGQSSQRDKLGLMYDKIIEVALPGDVIFYISDKITDNDSPVIKSLRTVYRRWQGFDPLDSTEWHTTIYVGSKKEKKGSQQRPRIVHAYKKGVEEIHLRPSFLKGDLTDTGEVVRNGRIEVLQNPDISPLQRKKIVTYAREQIGKPFENLNWRYLAPTYLFGLPTRRLDPAKASCHGLAYHAYGLIGLSFPHHLDDMPFFNPAKYLEHPLFGHPTNRVNLDRLYLVDHYLYRDSRFKSVLAVSEDTVQNQFVMVENPGKYSWNQQLQKRYHLNS